MDAENFLEPEVATTAIITAALFSPRVRKVIRKGVVYGAAGVLVAGDVVTSFARSLGRGMQVAASTAAQQTQNAGSQGQQVGGETIATSEVEAAARGSTPLDKAAAKPSIPDKEGTQ
ncbi:hypothetical protein KSD_16980 [Ktedonobacter sp. SOSP1-85]|uniref:hypothetical protein n=1 Tax=Ktedonobacter sp. SOSP1-85 TaxID=2778367 RepID=UPI001915E98F|nr:hypothetical protein [Ktedonobacter sp. SOSP1-85]GHO73927.1 hypothetical protein KSD_16980 [Ktedonobacter sp. SOSP1-85]